MKNTDRHSKQTPHRLLLVDDDVASLALLCAYFSDTNYQITQAKDGAQALNIIQSRPGHYFSAYVFDYRMPNIDGLTLLQALKADARYEMVPAILQTSADSYEDINRGIQAGAFYYLLKPFSKNHLLSIVEAAIKGFTSYQHVVNVHHNQPENSLLLVRAHFTYQTIEQAQNLTPILTQFTPNPQKVAIGLFELLVNAVEHGNLGIGYHKKTTLIENDKLKDEITKRLSLEKNKHKFVDVVIERKERLITITIQDMGDGFDSQPYLDFSIERAMDNHGRGIMMARKLSFDQVHFSKKGNVAYCTVYID